MIETEERALRTPLVRRSGMLRSVARLGVAAMVFAVASYVIVGVAFVHALASGGISRSNALMVAYYCAREVIPVALYVILALFFRSLATDGSPFSMRQARRLRAVAALLVVDEVVGLVSIPGATGFSVGFVQIPAPVPTVDIRSLVIAALLVVISFVFEYGERLQSDSDEIA